MAAVPKLLTSGRFAVYDADGKVHVTVRLDGETEERHYELPALAAKMLRRKAGLDGVE